MWCLLPDHQRAPLTHWGRDKMDAISQTTFSSTFSWMKIFEFRIKISLKFVPSGSINNIPALVQIMAWHRPGDKPFSEPMMVNLPTHICVTRPQWVNDKDGLTHQLNSQLCKFRSTYVSYRNCMYITCNNYINRRNINVHLIQLLAPYGRADAL